MKREVKTEKAVSAGGITIVPVVEVRLGSRRLNGALFFSGVKQPRAILIIAAGTKRAFNLEGKEMPLDELPAEVTGLGI